MEYKKFSPSIFIKSLFLLLLFCSFSFGDAGGLFQRGPDMNTARMAHYSTVLPNGKLIVFGGHGKDFVSLNSSEIWDLTTNSFTQQNMQYPHDGGALARLKDGRILIAGGAQDLGVAPGYNTAEIYDPVNNTFTSVGQMQYARCNSKAATLESGNVLVVGGWYSVNPATYGEVFNPSTNTFSSTGPLNTPRANPLVLPTADGKAVVVGGVYYYGGEAYESVELYDPQANSFSVLSASLISGETGWKIDGIMYSNPVDDYRLADGKYLLLAYKINENSTTSFAIFTFDPATKAFTKLNIPLPDTNVVLWMLAPVVDRDKNKAYLLTLLKTDPAIPSVLRLYTIDITNMSLNSPSGSYTLSPVYFMGNPAISLLGDGRIFVTGGTTSIDYYYNFNPVKYTLFITPVPSLPQLSVNLVKEWNFVSFSRLPTNTSIENVLGSENLSKVNVVWGFDNNNKKWLKWRPDGGDQNKITSFEFGRGYWIHMNDDLTIDMTGWKTSENKTVPLFPGWNLVGWIGDDNKSATEALNPLSENWSVLWTWKNGNWSVKHESLTGLPFGAIDNFQNGRAYWIRMKNEIQWQQ